jgi:hypothetical protein
MSDSDNTNTNIDENAETGFGINDLLFTMQVYEAVAQRGAFRADELSNVGAVYDRLRAFLIANGALQAPAQPEPGTTNVVPPATGVI